MANHANFDCVYDGDDDAGVGGGADYYVDIGVDFYH